ncbi:MAG TPA: phospholipid-binding protein [Geobacter sp.]|nr:phospholipid-binding protein [Geobacter sp.]
MRKVTLCVATALTAAVAFSAPTTVTAKEDQGTKADNAKMNKEQKTEETAEQQKETKSDREITRKIRRMVVKDKSLSMKAHNVKIITKDGKVTLKGPVKTDKEKEAVQKAARKVAGKDNVTNELEVAPPK